MYHLLNNQTWLFTSATSELAGGSRWVPGMLTHQFSQNIELQVQGETLPKRLVEEPKGKMQQHRPLFPVCAHIPLAHKKLLLVVFYFFK